MSTSRGTTPPTRGDVIEVRDADDGFCEIRLFEYPFLLRVKVRTTRTGPEITELHIIADDDGAAIDYTALRAVPARRLAAAAAQAQTRALHDLGAVAVGDEVRPEIARRPENADPRVWEVAQRVVIAQERGEHVRRVVAADMGISPATLDRLIRRAKDEGLLDEGDLVRRKQPSRGTRPAK